MNLLETLDEEVYYDGVCTFFEDDGKRMEVEPEFDFENDFIED